MLGEPPLTLPTAPNADEQLRLNFGVGLEDVQTRVVSSAGVPPGLVAALQSVGKLSDTPASSQSRREELTAQLRAFYARHEPNRNTPAETEKFNAVVEYGMTRGLKKLNQALRDKYSDDLDTVRRNTIRQSVRDFMAANNPQALKDDAQNEEVVQFAMDNGVGALDYRLRQEYGMGVNTAHGGGF